MARRGLGRGLNALIPTMERPSENELNAIIELPLDKIIPNKNQPRSKFSEDSLAELAESIKEFGVIQPIVVRKLDGVEKYEIITGERRYRATKNTGITTIPSIVVNDIDDISSLEMALIENIHREDLSPMEKAHTYKQLIEEFKITHEKLSKRIGKSRASITNTLRLLALPVEIQKMVNEGKISEGHARAILTLDNDNERINLANHIIKNDLSVREAEKIVERKRRPAVEIKAKKVLQLSKIPEIASKLSEFLNAPVKITMSKKKGKIIVEFGTVKDLERIVERIVR
ncbi:MAG: ParB/RepB/Spo0J family partition protein [Actinomycetota bacterium]|nr:ParB/RepB/Spo0J family partition protein [Actinomycetota bacterium]MDD5600301.1 ParB/RepB/Spo0J family partition protein [Actinomycetota bacterium]